MESEWARVWNAVRLRSRDFVSVAVGNKGVEDAILDLDRLVSRIHQTMTAESLAVLVENRHMLEAVEKAKKQKEAYAWLSPPDPNTNQEERQKQGLVVPEHGQWLLDLPSFQDWLVSCNGFFWVSASAGVGKSVLCARVVEHLQEMTSAAPSAIAFFYFDYRDPSKRTYHKFIASVVDHFSQTSRACQELLHDITSMQVKAQASKRELEGLLVSMLSTAEEKFLVIDALDECLETERQQLLPFLVTLAKKVPPGGGVLRIFTTSRPEHDIEHSLYYPHGDAERLITYRLFLGERLEHLATLDVFIKTELDGPKFYGLEWSTAFRQQVADELLDKSKSMFLWVQLQLQRLSKCSETEARHMIRELPEGLPATYARILSEIDFGRRTTIRAVLECMIAASEQKRPLSLMDIGELFRFELHPVNARPRCLSIGVGVPLVGVNGGPSRVNPINILKLLPSGLLKLGEDDNKLHFIHFTVQEYLLSYPLESTRHSSDAALSNNMLAAFGTSREKAISTLLLVLLSALSLNNSPYVPHLTAYADKSWFILANAALPDYASIKTPLGHFLDSNASLNAFREWVRRGYTATGIKAVAEDHPIHWAVRIGSLEEAKRLIQLDLETNAEPHLDIRNAYDGQGWTPLCYAAFCGDVAMLDFLLEDNESWGLQRVGLEDRDQTIIQVIFDLATLRFDLLGSFDDELLPISWLPRGLAEWSQSVEILKKLLAITPNPKQALATCTRGGQTALMRALCIRASRSSVPPLVREIIDILLANGSDPNAQDDDGRGILHYAARSSLSVVIQMVSDKFAIDVNAVDNMGVTPLHEAVYQRSVVNVEALLRCGADLNLCDNGGNSPLDVGLVRLQDAEEMLACIVDPSGVSQDAWQEELLCSKKIYTLLEQRGARLNRLAIADI
ncbi:hypothetical protein DL93DRAFT_1270073 [Clavulina sp. PMI_390]|nr:hypothetical protein DL93DRAFT_1270073 [Clavulina sp. PMI_390]